MFEKNAIARLEAKLKREAAKVPASGAGNALEIEQLRAATAQSNAELLASQKLIMDQLLELKAVKDAPVSTPEWEFRIQRDGADKMIGVVAKPLGGKEGA